MTGKLIQVKIHVLSYDDDAEKEMQFGKEEYVSICLPVHYEVPVYYMYEILWQEQGIRPPEAGHHLTSGCRMLNIYDNRW